MTKLRIENGCLMILGPRGLEVYNPKAEPSKRVDEKPPFQYALERDLLTERPQQ